MPRVTRNATLLRFGALGDVMRLRVLAELKRRGPTPASELAAALNVPRGRLWPHVRRLLDAGLIGSTGGRIPRFSVSRAGLSELVADIENLGDLRGPTVEHGRSGPLEGEG